MCAHSFEGHVYYFFFLVFGEICLNACYGLTSRGRPAQELRQVLSNFRSAFASEASSTARNSALKVSALIARACVVHTEPFFAEVFARFRSLSALQRKWLLEMLFPWCESIILDKVFEEFVCFFLFVFHLLSLSIS
jgi:hypothetical protein